MTQVFLTTIRGLRYSDIVFVILSTIFPFLISSIASLPCEIAEPADVAACAADPAIPATFETPFAPAATPANPAATVPPLLHFLPSIVTFFFYT